VSDVEWVGATEYVQQLVKAATNVRRETNPDEFLQRALAEWPMFDQLVARFYVDFQHCVEQVDKASREGLPSKDRDIGELAAYKNMLAWMTKFAKAGRAVRYARKG